MLPGIEMAACSDLAVPAEVMTHVARVESSFNPFAIGVVGGRLVRQPQNLSEAVSTARMLESKGYNFSLGISQVNRHNLIKYGLDSYEKAFQVCPNVVAGSRILAECYERSNSDWGKAFSCYYSGNFVTGYRHGYVQKIYASIAAASGSALVSAIPLVPSDRRASSNRTTPVQARANALPSVDAAISTLAARRGGVNTLVQPSNSIDRKISEQGGGVGAVQYQAGDVHQATPVAAAVNSEPLVLGGGNESPHSAFTPAAVETQLPASAAGNHDSALVF